MPLIIFWVLPMSVPDCGGARQTGRESNHLFGRLEVEKPFHRGRRSTGISPKADCGGL